VANTKEELLQVARGCVKTALAAGANEAAVVVSQGREVSVQWRDGRLEKMHEATTRGALLELFVNGRYGTVRTGDLRDESLEAFIAESVAMTGKIAQDPYRSLPDPALYRGQTSTNLETEDPAHDELTPERRREMVEEIEAAARSVPGASDIVSVAAGFGDERSLSWRVHSNGFEGCTRATVFSAYGEVSVQDADGRKPDDWSAAVTRFYSDLPPVAEEGRQAALRALEQRGPTKIPSGVMTMAVDHRAMSRLVSVLLGPLSAQVLQQKRSFLEGKLGERIGSELFTLTDQPFIKRGLGSQVFDSEGIAAVERPIIERGILRNYYIDTYYGKKLNLAPTSGGPSNLVLQPGKASQVDLLSQINNGILVTSFLGGNSNGTTGDFSFGVQGYRITNGKRAEPVSEMNISGNLAELWQHLVAVGNDPYPYSRIRLPTCVFDRVQFAGT
jgi:PmbA protein